MRAGHRRAEIKVIVIEKIKRGKICARHDDLRSERDEEAKMVKHGGTRRNMAEAKGEGGNTEKAGGGGMNDTQE